MKSSLIFRSKNIDKILFFLCYVLNSTFSNPDAYDSIYLKNQQTMHFCQFYKFILLYKLEKRVYIFFFKSTVNICTSQKVTQYIFMKRYIHTL